MKTEIIAKYQKTFEQSQKKLLLLMKIPVKIKTTIFLASGKWSIQVQVLKERGIIPENLPPEEDIKKAERRLKSDDRKLLKETKRLKKDKARKHNN